MKAIKWFHKTFEVPQTAKIKLRIDFDFEIVFNERIGIAKRNPDWAFLPSPLTMKRYLGQRIKIRRYWITIFLSNLSIADLFFLLLRKTAENLFQGTDPGFSYSAMWRVKIGLGNAEIVTTKQPPPPPPPSSPRCSDVQQCCWFRSGGLQWSVWTKKNKTLQTKLDSIYENVEKLFMGSQSFNQTKNERIQ